MNLQKLRMGFGDADGVAHIADALAAQEVQGNDSPHLTRLAGVVTVADVLRRHRFHPVRPQARAGGGAGARGGNHSRPAAGAVKAGGARRRLRDSAAMTTTARRRLMARACGLLQAVVAGTALLAAGCAGVQLQQNVHQVRQIAKEARENGAYRCAPRQLALAETNIEFADAELGEGDYFRAREHPQITDHNTREAYTLSPRDRCVGPADRDGDGNTDDIDN